MKRKLILYTLVAAIGGLLYGFDTAVINGALPFFTEYFRLNDVMTGWAVSSALLGSIAEAIGGGNGIGYSFAFFSIMTFIGFFLFKKFLFETSKLTLEEIERRNK